MSKKLAAAVLLVSACAGLAFGQTPTLPAKGPSVAETVKQLERDWVDAGKTGDVGKLSQILADDWIGVGYDGTRETKKSYLAAMKKHGVNRSRMIPWQYSKTDL